jgi:hypothetical protein
MEIDSREAHRYLLKQEGECRLVVVRLVTVSWVSVLALLLEVLLAFSLGLP